MQNEWLKYLFSLPGEGKLLLLLVDAHLEVLTRVFDLLLQFEQLLECMVKEDDLASCLMWQTFADLFEALRSLE